VKGVCPVRKAGQTPIFNQVCVRPDTGDLTGTICLLTSGGLALSLDRGTGMTNQTL